MIHLNSSTAPEVVSSQKPTEPANRPIIASFIQSDELLTIAEVAGYLKLSRRTTWRWCKSGQLPAVKVGHQWRVARSDLEVFVYQRRTTS